MTHENLIAESTRLHLLDQDGPLVTMITYERAVETRKALSTLLNSLPGGSVRILVIDNNSASETLHSYLMSLNQIAYVRLRTNIGCPRALNFALAYRRPGQDFVKIDPDVEIVTPNWYARMSDLTRECPHAALVGAYYPGSLGHSRLLRFACDAGRHWAEVSTANGRLMLHSGEWLDQAGYFDVLNRDQLWGYEDLLMCHRAHAAGRPVVIDTSVCLNKLPTVSSYGLYERNEQLRKLDELYWHRAQEASAGSIKVDASGKPIRA